MNAWHIISHGMKEVCYLEIKGVDGEELVGAGFVSPDVALQHPVVPRQRRAQKGAHVSEVGAHQRQRHGLLLVIAVVAVGIRGTAWGLAVDHHCGLGRVLHHRHFVLAAAEGGEEKEKGVNTEGTSCSNRSECIIKRIYP